MRLKPLAIAVLLTCSATIACGGGGGIQQDTPPPPTPPGVTRFTLKKAIHHLRANDNGFVRHPAIHVTVASDLWRECEISIVVEKTIAELLFGINPRITTGDNTIRLGERFYATEENATGSNHEFNWTVIEQAGFRYGQPRAKGADSHYSKEIMEYRDGVWTTVAAGVTPVTRSPPDNYSVIEPQGDGNNRLNLAHEIGHQLHLPTENTNGNLMCENTSCTGTTLTGSVRGPNPLGDGTQCLKAQDEGDFWNLFEEG